MYGTPDEVDLLSASAPRAFDVTKGPLPLVLSLSLAWGNFRPDRPVRRGGLPLRHSIPAHLPARNRRAGCHLPADSLTSAR